MDRKPTAQLLWGVREKTVRRHVTVAQHGFSASVLVNEVTMVAAAEEFQMATGDTSGACPDLELGAHVARMHTLFPDPPAPTSPSPYRGPSPVLRVPPRQLAAAWESF